MCSLGREGKSCAVPLNGAAAAFCLNSVAAATVATSESGRALEPKQQRELSTLSGRTESSFFAHLEPRLLQRHEPSRRLLLSLIDLQGHESVVKEREE